MLRPPPSLLVVAALLWLVVAAPARGQENIDLGAGPVVLTADELRYERAAETVVAEGNVELSRGERRLLADRVVYAVEQDQVEATGRVVLIEPGGAAVFADRVALTGDLREGFIQSVGVLFADDSRLAAVSGRRVEGNRTTLERAVYSPCPLCPERDRPPLWRLRAARVIHDQQARDVIYHHAVFELFGFPIVYLPYFRHSDPLVERKTGFLTPGLGSRGDLGFFAETPFYLALAPNRDLTVTPAFFTEEPPLLGVQYRELRPNGRFELGGTATYATGFQSDPDEEPPGREFRGHAEGLGRFALDDEWGWGYQLELTTDDTYLRRYDISNDSILESRLFAERIWERHYAAINGFYFQGLRQEDEQGLIPVVLPLAELSLTSEPWRWGSQFELDAGFLALTRTDGLDTRRMSVRGGWELPYLGPLGDVYTLNLSLRGDVYHTDGDPETKLENGTRIEGRAFPVATLDWRWPLVRVDQGGALRQVIEPVVVASWSPEGVNDENIPNEDSLDFEFDDTNLFEADRFTGLDLVEEGARISYGLRFGAYGPRGELLSGLFGQSYRFQGRGAFPEDSGLDSRLSDYVGRLDLSPVPWLDLSYRFRARRENFRPARNDVRLGLGPPRLRLDLGFLSLTEEPEQGEFRERKELTLGVYAGVLPSLGVRAFTRRDLDTNNAITNLLGVVYSHPCLVVAAELERSFTRDRELEPTTTVRVRLTLKNLGEIETESGLAALGSS